MTPNEFIRKWLNSGLKERAAAQEHFIDLCNLLGEPTPAAVDSSGLDYAFEVGATKTTGGHGFADVFKRGCFAWEYKGTHSNLDHAFAQLQRYAIALDNPPLLIVSDIGTTIRIHTNWTNSVSKIYELPIAELNDAEKRAWLKAAFSDPDALKPKKTRQELTEEVAGEFAALASSLRDRGHNPEQVAHFINRLVFCMFAEDVKLLSDRMFARMLERAVEEPHEFVTFARDLFGAMSTGGRVGFEKVAWFNGGLFNDDQVFELTKDEIKLVQKAANQYWGDIDPSILGTLFERGLDPNKRGQLGAHYTDREKIMMIVKPIIVDPLTEEWESERNVIVSFLNKASAHEKDAKTKGGRIASAAIGQATNARKDAQAILDRYLKRLADFRVLDPACGSGNFLYLALRALKDLEHRAQVEAEALGLPRRFPTIGPEVVKGIEINPYAAELARVSVWIGEIQWMIKNGFPPPSNPVLKPLETIECRDALVSDFISPSGLMSSRSEAEWPSANVIIGNPPFLGSRKMAPELGVKYTDDIRQVFSERVHRGADLVCFWFAKAWDLVKQGKVVRVGLIATNSISGGSSRKVLEPIADHRSIFAVWKDQPWIVEGATVDVSLICFGSAAADRAVLDGVPVDHIFADLHSPKGVGALDITHAKALAENANTAFQGVVPRSSVKKSVAKALGLPSASFAVSGGVARPMLLLSGNPNGRSNTEVLVPYLIGDDITKRPRDRYVVDFGTRSLQEAERYEAPFSYIQPVRAHRAAMTQREALEHWWLHWRSRPEMRAALSPLSRFIVTPRVSKYRIFVWAEEPTLADNAVVAIARADYVTFGILQSRFHRLWSLRKGTSLQDRPRYTPTTTFATFPFPKGLTPNTPSEVFEHTEHAKKIGLAAAELDQLRKEWLNPKELIKVAEVSFQAAKYVPVDKNAAAELKKRTMTNLYNLSPTWLVRAHQSLDEAVATAYGVSSELEDDDVLQFLLRENLERTSIELEETEVDVEEEEEDVS